MAEKNDRRTEQERTCPNCGAIVEYDVKQTSGGEKATDTIRCPSCGREIDVEGTDPRLEEFGPGLGQSGA